MEKQAMQVDYGKWFLDKTRNNALLVLLILGFLIPQELTAQKSEVRASLNSGFFYYGGNGATSVSSINGTTYTNNPYGSKGALSYGLSVNLRRVSEGNFIFGADIGYEMLRSKVNLAYNDVIGDIASDFKGQTYLNTSFINLFPYLGRRFAIKAKDFDLVAGVDVGRVLTSREKGDAKSTPTDVFHIETSRDRKNLQTDVRPRIQLSTDFDKLGLYVGYSYGLINYTGNYIGSSSDTYSRFWRMGITYRLNQ
jgi:hypothetical protein